MNKKGGKTILFSLVGIVLAALIFMILGNLISSGKPTKYNFIFLVSDALRHDMLGCYGGNAKTPNLDWIAENGILFKNAYSTASFTRASSIGMSTGCYAGAYSFKRKRKDHSQRILFHVNEKEILLAEAIKEAEYDVRMDLENPIANQSNNMQGFESLVHDNQKTETNGINNKRSDKYLHYLNSIPKNHNFFLLKWFLDPHSPYDPPEIFRKQMSSGHVGLPRSKRFYSNVRAKDLKKLFERGNLSKNEIDYLKKLYMAEIEYLDERIGLILKILKKRNLIDKTFILFTSDHGESFGEHNLMGHGYGFSEPQVHIPLMIMGPGIPRGLQINTVVSSIDIMPTIKELLNITYNENMQGISLCHIFSGKTERDNCAYIDIMSSKFTPQDDSDALIKNRYKLIVNKPYNNCILFNTENDPGELLNISDKHPDIVKKMLEIIVNKRKQNDQRSKQNKTMIKKKTNVEKKWRKTQEVLKNMGYIE